MLELSRPAALSTTSSWKDGKFLRQISNYSNYRLYVSCGQSGAISWHHTDLLRQARHCSGWPPDAVGGPWITGVKSLSFIRTA